MTPRSLDANDPDLALDRKRAVALSAEDLRSIDVGALRGGNTVGGGPGAAEVGPRGHGSFLPARALCRMQITSSTASAVRVGFPSDAWAKSEATAGL